MATTRTMNVATDNGLDDEVLERIKSEEMDQETSPPSYQILTYPADFTLEVLVDKWKKENIIIPKFQRRFVWTQVQSSKLIESFLLGLPVPPIFLYADAKSGKMLVVDGQQRLKTIAYFFEGFFGEEDQSGKRPVFRLVGLSEESPFAHETFKDLEQKDPAAFRRLNDAVLRSFVIKQLNPEDDTSIYHIFERLNTGGTFLHGQEIRNCVYHGRFSKELAKFNDHQSWREIFGKPGEDKRQRDIELILRFLALSYSANNYKKPMKDFLNWFMSQHQNPGRDELGQFRERFTQTSDAVREHLGEKPFNIRAGLNAAAFDAVFTAFSHNLEHIPGDVAARYKKLVNDADFIPLITSATTDEDIVPRRLELAEKRLFGAKKP